MLSARQSSPGGPAATDKGEERGGGGGGGKARRHMGRGQESGRWRSVGEGVEQCRLAQHCLEFCG